MKQTCFFSSPYASSGKISKEYNIKTRAVFKALSISYKVIAPKIMFSDSGLFLSGEVSFVEEIEAEWLGSVHLFFLYLPAKCLVLPYKMKKQVRLLRRKNPDTPIFLIIDETPVQTPVQIATPHGLCQMPLSYVQTAESEYLINHKNGFYFNLL